MSVKEKLIQQIGKMEDEDLMISISSMISSLTKEGVYELEDTMIEELEQRSKKVKAGEFMTHEKLAKKFTK